MKIEMEINMWDYVDIEEINEALDRHLHKTRNIIATDIGYSCVEITKDGLVKIEADFTPEDY